MSALVALAGWLCAAGAAAAAALLLRERARRRELVARACHEIRGPLTAAGLALHLGATPAVEAELRRAARVLDDLWQTRDGRTGRDARDLVELRTVLREQMPAWRAAATACGREVLLAAGPPAWVSGDPERLVQAVSNLVANALEHGAGPVRVTVRTLGPRARVEVADGGPGLPAPVAALTARPRAGRGMRGRGLAIASELAARHGGRLSAAPAARGARLVLDLPAAGAGASRAARS